MKSISYKSAARKTLRNIPAKIALRIIGKIEAYAENPSSQANNVKALQGRDGIRLLVGSWRVNMKDGEVLEVLAIGSRGSIYE